jgi:hypothetical protein
MKTTSVFNYGHDKTIHRTKILNVEVDKNGRVVSVWFRCMALPFDMTVVDDNRAIDMDRMNADHVSDTEIHGIDIKRNEDE